MIKMIDYKYAHEKMTDVIEMLLSLETDEVEKITRALRETLGIVKWHINDKECRNIISKIESKVNSRKFDLEVIEQEGIYRPSVENMDTELRQEIVKLMFELYDIVAEHYYKNYCTNR